MVNEISSVESLSNNKEDGQMIPYYSYIRLVSVYLRAKTLFS